MAVYICTICGEKYECDGKPRECAVCGNTDFRVEEKTVPTFQGGTSREPDTGDIGHPPVKQDMTPPPVQESRVQTDWRPEPVKGSPVQESQVQADWRPEPVKENPVQVEWRPEPVQESQVQAEWSPEPVKEKQVQAERSPESVREEPGDKGRVKIGGALWAVILIALGSLVLCFKRSLIPFLYGTLGIGRIIRGVYPETVVVSMGVLLTGCGMLLAVIWLVGLLKRLRKA
ncbi:MAG: hypothetical protein NC121_04850 [Blautia sp.]|nr:hypothetical protein [Blautia sp.]